MMEFIQLKKILPQKERKMWTIIIMLNILKNAAELGVLDNNSESIIFTDVDSYNSISENQEEVILNDFSQKPWGDETSQTEIILFNNRPNFMWGLSGFAFNNSPFGMDSIQIPIALDMEGFIILGFTILFKPIWRFCRNVGRV